MVEIITSDGIRLDLAPDAEFEVEMENPFCTEDHIPIPYSTSISLLPTPTNCKALWWMNALKVEPFLKEIEATLFCSGIPVFSGKLIYDNIEDGAANYTFNGRGLEDHLDKMISETEGLVVEDYETLPSFLSEGGLEGVSIPVVLNASMATETAYLDKEPAEDKTVNCYLKIRNFPVLLHQPEGVIPAVSVERLLSVVDCVDYGDISEYLENLAVLGTYQDIVSKHSTKASGRDNVNLAEMLPDVSVGTLLRGLCQMFGASVYTISGGFIVKRSDDVLGSSEVLNWGGKISDSFSSSVEKSQEYKLSFEGTGTFGSKIDSSTTVRSFDGFHSFLEGIKQSDIPEDSEYKPYRISQIGDIFSAKLIWSYIYQDEHSGTRRKDVLMDILSRRWDPETDEKGNEYTNNVPFTIPPTVPCQIFWFEGNNLQNMELVAPLVTIPSVGEEKSNDVYLGIVQQGQFCDKGRTYVYGTTNEIQGELSLEPNALVERFHHDYSYWIGKNRQVITADVDLSVSELASFRMWQKVRFSGRDFLVRKMSVRFGPQFPVPRVTAEFISL